MRRTRSVSEQPAKNSARTRLAILLVAAAAVALAIVPLIGGATLAASGNAAPDQGKARHYKGTRAFVVDKETGRVRMPTQQEVDEVVSNLSSLGQRPAENLQQSAQASGAISLDLDGGFAGVMLARPNPDGTWETKCVFTLEEGAEFLGIVEDDSIR